MRRSETFTLSNSSWLRSAIGIALVFSWSAAADEKDDLARLEREASEAENGSDLQRAVRKYLDVPGNVDRINTLRNHSDDTLSLCAAWQVVRDSVPAERQGRRNNLRRPSITAIERFLGFAEGRLRIGIPQWWEDSVRGSYSDGSTLWTMSRHHAASEYQTITLPPDLFPENKDRQLLITRDYVLYPEKDAIILRSTIYRANDGDAKLREAPPDKQRPITCKLPDAVVEKIRKGQLGALTCYMDDRFCLVATTSLMAAAPYEVHCIDHREGRTVWRATVLTGGGGNGAIPAPGFHAASIELKQGRVLIFGSETFGAYFECFSVKDGRPRFRFSTSY